MTVLLLGGPFDGLNITIPGKNYWRGVYRDITGRSWIWEYHYWTTFKGRDLFIARSREPEDMELA